MRTLRHISLSNLRVALDDLFAKRQAALQSSAYGGLAQPVLAKQRDKIKALPAALTGRPLADELGQADRRHDGIGGAVWHQVESYLLHPDTTPEMRDAAKKIRAAFVPTLDSLMESYPAEAKAAKDHKDRIADLESALMLFPVAKGSLLDWVQGFVAAGETIDSLLSGRADAKDRKLATQIRNETVGMLNLLRKNIAHERKDNPSLPETLDADVFGYFDLLEQQDAAAAAEEKKQEAAKKAAKAAKAASPTAPTGTGTTLGGGAAQGSGDGE